MKILVFDLETTAISTREARIVSMCFHGYHSNKLKNWLYTLVNPKVIIENSDIHGITNNMTDNEAGFENYVNAIITLINEHDLLIGYNILNYDIPVLIEEEYRHCKTDRIKEAIKQKGNFIIDVYNECKTIQDLPSKKLKDYYTYFVKSKKKINFHNSKVDVICTFKIYEALLKTKYVLNKYDYRYIKDHFITEGEQSSYKLLFGKYKGELLKNVINNDPLYIKFCIEKNLLNLNI